MTRVVSALVVLLTVCPLTAQKPITPPPAPPIPDQTSQLRTNQYAVAVKGCVQNGRLKFSQSVGHEFPFETLGASEFLLEGPRELMRQIQEQHKGHYDEVEGIATVPPSPNRGTRSVTTKKMGPVRVTAGNQEASGVAPVEAPRPIKLRVSSFTHISEGCVARP